MGNYRIEIEAVGGHGCMRGLKDGEFVPGCGTNDCPDCETRKFVALLKDTHQGVSKATLTHWPGEPTEVVDNLLTGLRKGSF